MSAKWKIPVDCDGHLTDKMYDTKLQRDSGNQNGFYKLGAFCNHPNSVAKLKNKAISQNWIVDPGKRQLMGFTGRNETFTKMDFYNPTA